MFRIDLEIFWLLFRLCKDSSQLSIIFNQRSLISFNRRGWNDREKLLLNYFLGTWSSQHGRQIIDRWIPKTFLTKKLCVGVTTVDEKLYLLQERNVLDVNIWVKRNAKQNLLGQEGAHGKLLGDNRPILKGTKLNLGGKIPNLIGTHLILF